MRPRLLDLFCGAGGAAVGYHRAGFDVVGVDINPQPHYPFEFHQGDALLISDSDIRQFDAVHASPPCQAHTTMSNRWRGAGGKADGHVDRIAVTRLHIHGLPYVIENVPGARKFLIEPITLTGGMFKLGVHRPRLFESNMPLYAPPKAGAPRDGIGVYGKQPDGRRLWTRRDGSTQRAAASVAEAQQAMGMDWCPDWRGIAEAIPPAYTEWIGAQLLEAVRAAA